MRLHGGVVVFLSHPSAFCALVRRNVQSLVEQGQKGELTMQPGKSMMESLESSINKVRVSIGRA